MKVTLINSSDAGGGAPMACMRLLKALQTRQVDAQLLVNQKKTGDDTVHAALNGLMGRLKVKYHFLRERLPFIFFNAADTSVRFAFSTAVTGTDISAQKTITDADILHLHWINQGFLSTNNLRQLTQLGKPIVWTLHDMWAFTGGCHYAGTCDHFMHECGHCWMLKEPDSHDISHTGWKRKMHLLADPQSIVFVTCSNWLAGVARKSSLLKGYRIEAIPNPIDTQLYQPQNKMMAREKWGIHLNTKVILFGAANILDRRKGMGYLVEALELLKATYTGTGFVEVVIFGKNKSFDVSMLPFKVYALDVITSQQDLAELYSLADVFVTPAIEDNLPNTVMEALACGTPVVAFDTGGIPDMVDHQQNGYLAKYKSAADFADGINFVLQHPDTVDLANKARQKVLDNFTNEIVAEKYLALYRSLNKDEQ